MSVASIRKARLGRLPGYGGLDARSAVASGKLVLPSAEAGTRQNAVQDRRGRLAVLAGPPQIGAQFWLGGQYFDPFMRQGDRVFPMR